MKFKDHYFLTETLSNELVYLKRYLNSSVKEKAINRAFNNSYLIMPDKKYRNRYKQLGLYFSKEEYSVVEELKQEGFNITQLVKNFLKSKLEEVKKR